MDLTTLEYLYVGFAAFLIGFTKTSVGGVGILAVLLMAMAISGKASTGAMIPMALAADVMAVIYYRRACQWNILRKLFPLTLVGVIVGYFILKTIPDYNFTRVIGWIILAMLGFDLSLTDGLRKRMKGHFFTSIAGVLAGSASMVANAAGPIFGIYLLQMGLKKSEFVGTRSWFFLVINIAKFIFGVALGIINVQSLTLDISYLPVILMGAYVGNKVLKYINIHIFKSLIRVAVLFAAVRLIWF